MGGCQFPPRINMSIVGLFMCEQCHSDGLHRRRGDGCRESYMTVMLSMVGLLASLLLVVPSTWRARARARSNTNDNSARGCLTVYSQNCQITAVFWRCCRRASFVHERNGFFPCRDIIRKPVDQRFHLGDRLGLRPAQLLRECLGQCFKDPGPTAT